MTIINSVDELFPLVTFQFVNLLILGSGVSRAPNDIVNINNMTDNSASVAFI